MRGGSGEDAAGALVLVFLIILLCYAVLVLGLIFIILSALLFLCWVLTYWLLRLVNEVLTDNWVTESEGLLALVIPFFLYAVLAWWFFPPHWAWQIAAYLGWSLAKTWLNLVVGAGLLGLAFGFLSLPMLESREPAAAPALDGAGMLPLPDHHYEQAWAEESWDILNEGVLLGEDI